jgi:TetR/AcrR family transcriptional regulator, cholesterol catabolism regulator
MSGGTTRVRSKSIRKRQRILDAAAKALADQGYSGTNLSDIAREVGIHTGSLYYHFASREDLVIQVLLTALERMSAQFTEALESDRATAAPMNRLRAFIRVVLARRTSAKDDYTTAYIRNFNQIPESIRRAIAAKRHQVRTYVSKALTRLVSEAQAAGQIEPELDASLAALFIVGATNWVGLWYRPWGPKTPEQISKTFTNLLMLGLGGVNAPRHTSAALQLTRRPSKRV